MATSCFTNFLLLLLLAIANTISCEPQTHEVVEMALSKVLHAMDEIKGLKNLHGSDNNNMNYSTIHGGVALDDCVKLYEESEPRLALVLSGENYDDDDAITWLSAALASHRSCWDGLEEKGWSVETQEARNLTLLLKKALALYRHKGDNGRVKSKGVRKRPSRPRRSGGLLASWNVATAKADLVVAKDGSGNFKSINEAVAALARKGHNRPKRTIIYVKSGVYHEKVEIGRDLKNIMFVGDGMDKTIVTGNRNVADGASTLSSATFGVSGDGFWARDMTFENTAGPEKHQAVALRVSSDLSVFYRCSFKGYQDTLFVHSLRQFYRDCHIYGTVDFIFGDAAAVFQNCDIFVRRPMGHQANMITAQGRDDPNENTGISIINSRVAPAPDFTAVKGGVRNYLGRPWKKYSRTVFLKTDLDGMVDPRGWTEWSGNFALQTLYYAEYLNTGASAATASRVRWSGFHVLHDAREAAPFSVRNFIHGDVWIPGSGVPFSADI